MLSEEMQEVIRQTELFPVATASPGGWPNVVPVRFVEAVGEDRLWIVDNYFNKTLENLRANPRAALYLYSENPRLSVQIKGTIEIRTEGAEYESMRRRIHEIRADLPAKSLVILKIDSIYECLPAKDPGALIWPKR